MPAVFTERSAISALIHSRRATYGKINLLYVAPTPESLSYFSICFVIPMKKTYPDCFYAFVRMDNKTYQRY